jgi:hypothetical protein
MVAGFLRRGGSASAPALTGLVRSNIAKWTTRGELQSGLGDGIGTLSQSGQSLPILLRASSSTAATAAANTPNHLPPMYTMTHEVNPGP